MNKAPKSIPIDQFKLTIVNKGLPIKEYSFEDLKKKFKHHTSRISSYCASESKSFTAPWEDDR